MWLCIAVFLFITESQGCTENLIEYKNGDFYESLHSGKTMFVFFERDGRLMHIRQYGPLLVVQFIEYTFLFRNIYPTFSLSQQIVVNDNPDSHTVGGGLLVVFCSNPSTLN